MKKALPFLFVVLLCMVLPAVAQKTKPKPKSAPAGPSLDLLVTRIDDYWNSLGQKKKSQAAQYIAVSDRDVFYDTTIPSFSEPHLKSLELSADRREATATVIIKRVMKPLPTKMEWPVTEHWRFEKGNWYRSFQKSSFSLIAEGGKVQKLSPEQIQSITGEVRKMLQIEKKVLDFGTVRESAQVQLSLDYTLSGDEPLAASFKTPPGITIQGGNNQSLIPGQQQLLLNVSAWKYEGSVSERIVMTARRQGVEVPFEIELKGNVYIPVSIAPKTLKLGKENREKQVVVRNNSKSNVELLPVYTETGQVTIESLPAIIPPGKELTLKVTLKKGSSGNVPSGRDNLSIPFAERIDGLGVLSLAVVLESNQDRNVGNGTSELIPSDKTRACRAAPALR